MRPWVDLVLDGSDRVDAGVTVIEENDRIVRMFAPAINVLVALFVSPSTTGRHSREVRGDGARPEPRADSSATSSRPVAATQQQQATVASAQWPGAGGGGDARSGIWVLRVGRGALCGRGGPATPGIGTSHGGERESGFQCVFLNVCRLSLTPFAA